MRPTALVLALVVLAPACGGGSGGGGGTMPTPAGPFFTAGTGTEPTAGTWRTWVIDPTLASFTPAPPPLPNSTETQAELAELQVFAAARTPTQLADVATWDLGVCKRWNEQARALVASTPLDPPRASRAYLLLSVAMHDAMVAAWRSKHLYLRARPSAFAGAPPPGGVEPDTPSYVSERACLSAAAREVLAYVFPGSLAAIDALLQSALDADLVAGVAFRSDMEAGQALGQAVGAAVVADATTDGADAPGIATNLPDGTTYVPAPGAGTGFWCRTPPAMADPLLPGWGGVRTRALLSGDALLCATPPVWNSADGLYFRDEVHTVSLNLTPTLIAMAHFWADGGGTATPPGHWNQIAVDAAVADGLNEPRMARLLGLLNVAQGDAFVCCWHNKYLFNYPRPITEIQANIDPAWETLPGIATPPFPAYPSGHSSTSGAASQVLAYLLPAHAASFASMATDAKNSRLYGGIHYSFDNDAGLDLGRLVANVVVAIAASDGAP
jgi:membrane-associated phospholipid phosphatase